ncbi:4-hydroxythreonine-4-phosphate dehydrogenase PdxA [bacterium]|nr:4-hydroxythreonine-4-phosphate dehydrogenase PdxA [bacterium]
MGDPAGIGPEIIVKALSNNQIFRICRPIVIGDAGVLTQAVKICGLNINIRSIKKIADALYQGASIDVFDLQNVIPNSIVFGKVSGLAGRAAFDAIEKAIELSVGKQVSATVTCPINKKSLNLAGFHYSGHTEIYADLTNTRNYAMMLIDGNMKIVHVSTHVSLRQACDMAKKDRILKTIRLAYNAMMKFGVKKPKIGVAGLNPHAGESGLFGCEEEKEIIPAIKEAKQLGMNVDGPVPPDTLFSKAKGGQYDVVVAMYHDQGHIPLKVVGFNWNEKLKKWKSVKGVNLTLGLPIIRTSVDHGTAFDQAGKGTAIPQSLISAIKCAAKLAEGK